MKQTMYRIEKNKSNPYVMVNKEFLNDANLSLKAKGLLTYFMSLPDDWQIYESEIVKHHKDGKDSLSSAVRELIANGYIKRKRMRDEKGRLMAYEYSVYEVPIHIGKPKVGKSKVGKSAATNNDLTNNDGTKYNNDNGAISGEIRTLSIINQEVVNAINTYMNDLYKQKTGHKHPRLKVEQYHSVYDRMAAFADEWGVEYDSWTDMMVQFLNSNIDSDWNINHFATEGIMANRFYEKCY